MRRPSSVAATSRSGATWEAPDGPRDVAVEYARANSVAGNSVTIATNYDAADVPNENASCSGDLVFGALTTTCPNEFDAGTAPGGGLPYAVHAQATVAVPSICTSFLGYNFGPFSVSGQSTAYYDDTANQAKLLHVDTFICP